MSGLIDKATKIDPWISVSGCLAHKLEGWKENTKANSKGEKVGKVALAEVGYLVILKIATIEAVVRCSLALVAALFKGIVGYLSGPLSQDNDVVVRKLIFNAEISSVMEFTAMLALIENLFAEKGVLLDRFSKLALITNATDGAYSLWGKVTSALKL
jgi:hypothetical protein